MKEPNKNTICLFILTLFHTFVFTQENEFHPVREKEDVIDAFHAKQSSVKTLVCTFQQIKYISYLSAYIASNGKFYFKNNHFIRWEYTEPYQYAIIINDGNLKIEGNNDDINYKIRENKYTEKFNLIIQDLFKGDIFSNEHYNAVLEESCIQYRITLTPKESDLKSIISIVYLHFNRKTLSVSSIIIHEPSKDYTSISFGDQVFNTPIENDKFR